MILSYEEYTNYGGVLDETAFNIYCYEAEQKVKSETHGRIKNPSEAVKRCIARLTDVLNKADISKEKITSWSNDGVSQTMKDVSGEDYEKKIRSIIRDYLSQEVDETGTPLLYLGVC